MSYDFGLFGTQFDQYGGDTCHHSQGDTWHADVSIDVAYTWHDVAVRRQMTGLTGGVRQSRRGGTRGPITG